MKLKCTFPVCSGPKKDKDYDDKVASLINMGFEEVSIKQTPAGNLVGCLVKFKVCVLCGYI